MTRQTVVWALGLVLALGACTDDPGEDLPDPITTGNIESVNYEMSASGETFKAVGFATNGVGLVYVSPNPNATCENVTAYLNEGGDYDPVDVLMAGHCSVVFRFNYDAESGFDGVTHTQDDIGTFANVNCAMGDGVWQVEGSGQQRGYRYVSDDGSWWQGNAQTFSVTTNAGADDNTPDLQLDLGSDFAGQFIYDYPLEQNPATGSISGTTTAERCQGLTQTELWN